MFKILSWFLGLLAIFFIIFYGWAFIKDTLSGNENWFTNLNSGNMSLIGNLNNPNSMFQDNSNATSSGFLERLFPGLFPLFKVQPDNYTSSNENAYDLNSENTGYETPPQEVIDYVREVQNEAKYPNVNVNYQNNSQINGVIQEVNFGRH
jgi:hypothetical protein